MIGMTLTFLFLYALIFAFERKRREVDAFQIATAVIVPVVLAFIVGFGIGQVAPPIWTAVSAAVVLLITTYLVLLKVMGLSKGVAAAYATAVFAFYVTFQAIFAYVMGMV
ncbi:MAG: hypothetical protein OER85_18405 [Gammaproteobacteria bacterium]|nr:hypothetical protein [Gammaproteobacteria bacterium]